MTQFDTVLNEDNNVLVRGRHGQFLCNRYDIYIGGSLIKYGEFSEHENILLRRLCKSGNTVVEVGANIGAPSVPLAKHLDLEGALFAFEPQPKVFEILNANLLLNDVGNAKTYREAVDKPPCVCLK